MEGGTQIVKAEVIRKEFERSVYVMKIHPSPTDTDEKMILKWCMKHDWKMVTKAFLLTPVQP